jgi:hypothetical protein
MMYCPSQMVSALINASYAVTFQPTYLSAHMPTLLHVQNDGYVCVWVRGAGVSYSDTQGPHMDVIRTLIHKSARPGSMQPAEPRRV